LQICERAHEIFCVSARIVHFGKSESAEKIRTELSRVLSFPSQERPELIGAIFHVFAHFFSHAFWLSEKRFFQNVIFGILRTHFHISWRPKCFLHARIEHFGKNTKFFRCARKKKYAERRQEKMEFSEMHFTLG